MSTHPESTYYSNFNSILNILIEILFFVYYKFQQKAMTVISKGFKLILGYLCNID